MRRGASSACRVWRSTTRRSSGRSTCSTPTGRDHLAALAQLPEDERDATGARVIDERDYADIAAAHGTSQAAIRQRVSRGLAKLAGRVKEDEA
jgi:DNA-directed RNA polymerase specialized sigma24 family protein